MCNAWNHPPGCNCGWGGAWYSSTGIGGLGSLRNFSSSSGFASSSSSSSGSGDPSTRLISCWWCGASVYYHSNGYGDSVLFDSLGYPWQVHECWQRHKNETLRNRFRFTNSTAYFPYAEFVEAPTSTSSLDEQVSGYIVDNHFLHPNFEPITLLVEGFPASYRWAYLDVNDGRGNLFRFLIPSLFACHYKEYSMVEISGQWSKRLEQWLLAATKISIISYPSGKMETKEFKGKSPQKTHLELIKRIIKEAKKPSQKVGQEKQYKKNKNSKNKKQSRPAKYKNSLTNNFSIKPEKKTNKTASSKTQSVQPSQKVTRRQAALTMYKQGESISTIAKTLDIKIEAHVLQMILKAAIQNIKDSKKQPVEVSVANNLGLPVGDLRRQFGHLYKNEPAGIKLKELESRQQD